MNQDKLEVVKQEMARVNIDILRISELKWTRMGEFNSEWLMIKTISKKKKCKKGKWLSEKALK